MLVGVIPDDVISLVRWAKKKAVPEDGLDRA